MFKRKLLNTLILAGLSSVPAITMAADAPAEPAKATAPTLSQVLDASGITTTGYVDIGFTSLNSTGLFSNNAAISGGNGPSRVFDAPNPLASKAFSSFDLNQAAITVSKAPKEGFGGLINLTAGQDANVIASYGAGNTTTTSNPYNNNRTFDVTQAYASYAAGPVTVIAGKFATLAGAEVIAGPSNTNISRSILFGYAIPFTHTGARLTYAATDTVSLIAGINNGWDQLSAETTNKTTELGFTAAPNKMFSLAGSYYGGQALPAGLAAPGGIGSATAQATSGNRQLFDLVGTLNATDQLSFVLNYDNGRQLNVTGLANGTNGTAKWTGLAAYANYQFNDKWRTSIRSEYMNDRDGYRLPFVTAAGIGQKWNENTLTVAYMPAPSFELRGEFRRDTSTQNVFLYADGTAKNSQDSVGMEAIYKF